MQRVLWLTWFVTLALGAWACQRAEPAPPVTEQVQAEPGITYVNAGAAQRTTIRVDPKGMVSWTRQSITGSGISTSVELRWRAKQSPLFGLSSSLHEATGRWEGAIGVRDSVQRWRSLRVSSGGPTPKLAAQAHGADLVAALEQQLLGALELEQSERYRVPLPISAAAEAVGRCHTADRAAFKVVVVANAETGDYHEQISDERGAACLRRALTALRKATHVHGQPGLTDHALANGGRIEVRRGTERARADAQPPPEVPRDEIAKPDGPRRLYDFKVLAWPPRRSRFVLQPSAPPERGELTELELFIQSVGAQPQGPLHNWRFRAHHDQGVQLAWQHWSTQRETIAMEVAFDLTTDPAFVAELFEHARSQRLDEREHWQCGTALLNTHGDDESAGREATDRAWIRPFHYAPQMDTRCPFFGMTEQLKSLLNMGTLGAALERAVEPPLWGMRDCRASGRENADGVLELAGPQSRPALSAKAKWRAGDAAAAERCVRTALAGFEVPAELREVWHSGKLRVLLTPSGAGKLNERVEQPAPLDPVEVARAAYKTRW